MASEWLVVGRVVNVFFAKQALFIFGEIRIDLEQSW
jgi:hypothetical protein